jgi:Uri superfamily endonuclease
VIDVTQSGTYALLLSVASPVTVEVGALGAVTLPPGAFVYVGSAFGPGGLAARLRRHVQPEKASPHWHVDYLRAALSLHGAWVSTDKQRHECAWAQSIARLESASIPLPGAGASDCDCTTHFFRVAPPTEILPDPRASELAGLLTGTHTYVPVPDLHRHLLA